MSGTSMDAIDGVLVDFSNENSNQHPTIIAHTSLKISSETKQEILSLCQPGHDEINRTGILDIKLGNFFAKAANELITQAKISSANIKAIGSHGQTIRHMPNTKPAFTLQIGDPNTIAFETKITTIADFRRKDMCAGGQGAPLVPAFHQALFGSRVHSSCIINIGGMANITHLNQAGSVIAGFDTGPGNALLDGWIKKIKNKAFDDNGQWANTGKIIHELLDQLLAHPFFQPPPPKSTGREDFHLEWLQSNLNSAQKAEDIQRTLLEFTAQSICNAVTKHCQSSEEVIICGGGAYNEALINRIKESLPSHTVLTTTELGFSPDLIEAMAFAWLAKQTLEHKPGNNPASTGASQPCILGGIYYP